MDVLLRTFLLQLQLHFFQNAVFRIWLIVKWVRLTVSVAKVNGTILLVMLYGILVVKMCTQQSNKIMFISTNYIILTHIYLKRDIL